MTIQNLQYRIEAALAGHGRAMQSASKEILKDILSHGAGEEIWEESFKVCRLGNYLIMHNISQAPEAKVIAVYLNDDASVVSLV